MTAVEEIFSQGRHADKVIERFLKGQKKWGARDRRFFAESVYELVRWRRYLGALSGVPAMESLSNSQVLQMWAAWCLNTYHELPDWPELRDFDREAFRRTKATALPPAVRESVPDWFYELLGQELGKTDADATVKALNQQAEVFLRTNTLRLSREELMRKLQEENVDAVPVPGVDQALRLSERKNLFQTTCFKQGYFEVQDAGSQKIAPFLQVEPGQRVIDACAGGGGKSLHLAALMKNKGKIVAMDIHEWKLEELKTRARRNGVHIIETRVIDSSKVIKRLEDSADRLLLDVPCSGTGVLRRNPDAKWKLSMEEIQRLETLQAEILDSYSGMVKVGGLMVYATCSLLSAENEHQVERFLKVHGASWTLEKDFHLRPDREGFDGFYAALLRRKE